MSGTTRRPDYDLAGFDSDPREFGGHYDSWEEGHEAMTGIRDAISSGNDPIMTVGANADLAREWWRDQMDRMREVFSD